MSTDNLDFAPEEDDNIIKGLLDVNELNLEDELKKSAAQYHYYAKLATDTELILNQWRLHIGIHEARLTEELRSKKESIFDRKGNEVGQKPTTKYETSGDLKRAYYKDEMWVSMKQKELKLEYNLAVLNKATRALELKNGNIQSLNKRQVSLRPSTNNGHHD